MTMQQKLFLAGIAEGAAVLVLMCAAFLLLPAEDRGANFMILVPGMLIVFGLTAVGLFTFRKSNPTEETP